MPGPERQRVDGPGTYRLGRRLDPDRTNEVYQADLLDTDGPVVVKFLQRALAAGAEAAEASRRDALAVAKLTHPHIAAVLGLGTRPDGVPYVLQEQVYGETLASQMSQLGRMRREAALSLVNDIAGALSAAHEVGVVHGELRPSKIFLIEEPGFLSGFVKIVDFGLWRLSRDRHGPRALAEATRYTAPELLQGRQDVDGRTDQFALATIAYRMLGGTDAFPGRDAATVAHNVLKKLPRPLSELTTLPPMLDAVLRRAMAKDPGERFDSVQEFAAAFVQGVAGQPPSAANVRERP
jgi:serine/threonine protein kinase